MTEGQEVAMTSPTIANVPERNQLVDCRRPHGELLDLETGTVWRVATWNTGGEWKIAWRSATTTRRVSR